MSIKPELVERDENGYWVHSQIPETESSEIVKEWMNKNKLDHSLTFMEGDIAYDHPIYKSYFEDGNPNFSNWEPSKPEGRGWFIGGIYETEEGPVCMWLRQLVDKEKDTQLKIVKDAISAAEKAAFQYSMMRKEDPEASLIYNKIRNVLTLGG